MKKNLLLIIAPLIIIFLILFYLKFYKSHKMENPSYPKIVVVGLDGAGWNLINLLIKKLPNIRRLMKEGSYGILKTIKPTKSSVIWTSIATGKSMVKHGIVDWTYVNRANIRVPYTRSERRAKAFWNILSERGIKVGVVNWFLTFPPEKVNGFIVSDRFRHLIRKKTTKRSLTTYPAFLEKRLYFALQNRKSFKKILKEENLPDYRTWSTSETNIKRKTHDFKRKKRLVDFYPIFLLEDKTIEIVSLYLYKKFPVDAFATYFRLIDVVSHFGCGYINPDLLKKGIEEEEKKGKVSKKTLALIDKAFSKIMEPVYSYFDRILGKFLELINDDTTFIVISDHAFGFYKGGYGHYDTPEIPHGIILIKGPHIKKKYKIKDAHIYDILPTILYILDLPIGKDMDGKVLLEVFKKDFVKKRKIKYIETYETPTKRKFEKRDETFDKELLKELKALGYIK